MQPYFHFKAGKKNTTKHNFASFLWRYLQRSRHSDVRELLASHPLSLDQTVALEHTSNITAKGQLAHAAHSGQSLANTRQLDSRKMPTYAELVASKPGQQPLNDSLTRTNGGLLVLCDLLHPYPTLKPMSDLHFGEDTYKERVDNDCSNFLVHPHFSKEPHSHYKTLSKQTTQCGF